jgi:putative hydrolase of HD superfamily
LSEYDDLAGFAYEVGHLARTPRAGWQLPGRTDPESVAEHSHRTAVLAYVIAYLEGGDSERAATLAVFHDLPETRTTDLHSVAKRYVTAVDPVTVAKDQTSGLPVALAEAICGIVAEVDAKASVESVCAKDADKLDCLLRAREYQREGHTEMAPWIDNMLAGLRTPTAKALAERACQVPPKAWWHDIASSYGLPDPEGSPR